MVSAPLPYRGMAGRSLLNFSADGAKSLVAMECLIRVPLPGAKHLKLLQLLFVFLHVGKDMNQA
jgi:hypothetical protein